jgi:uncharacterized membrane protein YfcA
MLENPYFHLIIFVAGFTQGFTGFGSALIMLPLLTLLMGVKTVVPLVILLGLCINLILLMQVYREINWERIFVLLAGNVPGILCGVYILKVMSTSFLEVIIGVLLITFPPYLMLKSIPEREVARKWALPVGFLSGVLSGSVGAGGPPVIIYTAMQPWSKLAIKSTLVGFFLLTSVVASLAQAVGGLMTGKVLTLFAWSMPALFTGVLTGSWLFDRVDSGVYKKVLNVLLMLLGVLMLLKAVIGDS